MTASVQTACMFAHMFPVLFSSAASSFSAPYSTGWAKFACKYLLSSLSLANLWLFRSFCFSHLHSLPVAVSLFTLCSLPTFLFMDLHSTQPRAEKKINRKKDVKKYHCSLLRKTKTYQLYLFIGHIYIQ